MNNNKLYKKKYKNLLKNISDIFQTSWQHNIVLKYQQIFKKPNQSLPKRIKISKVFYYLLDMY